jgi:hypothetical protein
MNADAASRMLADRLRRDGILLQHDAVLPSATSMIAGEPVEGSWWSHPLANEIYDALQPLHHEATSVKLIVGKVTLVHRRLWPELVAIGRARQRWQLDRLSPTSTKTFEAVRKRRRAITVGEAIPSYDKKAQQAAVRDLERRLLIHSEEVHTEAGSHAKYLQTWAAFARVNGVPPPLPSASSARATFESIVADWPSPRSGHLLPWGAPARR